jgi:hypothetical protein
MKAKEFFYVCCGLLLLAAAYSLGARNAVAGLVDHTGQTGPVVALASDGISMLRFDGQVYAHTAGGWVRADWIDPLPVELSDIAFWNWSTLVTKEGVLWEIDTSGGQPPYPWLNRGQIPVPPVAVQSKTWSGAKSDFRK